MLNLVLIAQKKFLSTTGYRAKSQVERQHHQSRNLVVKGQVQGMRNHLYQAENLAVLIC